MHRRFESDPSEIAAARQFLREAVADHGRIDDLLVIVSELATNAVQHGGTAFEVLIHVEAARTRVQVADTGPGWPHRSRSRAPTTPGGKGLLIVSTLADHWGVTAAALGPGKTVWAEIEA